MCPLCFCAAQSSPRNAAADIKKKAHESDLVGLRSSITRPPVSLLSFDAFSLSEILMLGRCIQWSCSFCNRLLSSCVPYICIFQIISHTLPFSYISLFISDLNHNEEMVHVPLLLAFLASHHIHPPFLLGSCGAASSRSSRMLWRNSSSSSCA